MGKLKYFLLYLIVTHLVTAAIPAHLEDSPGPLVAVYQLAGLGAPNMDTFIKTPTRQKFSVR